mmetsp:Transcript_40975/g.66623  ORF Transcript_40975/g.66623 Transcript_40975/m.66623 type:complete len:114 (+) Transcript_40975:1273-1614(+)
MTPVRRKKIFGENVGDGPGSCSAAMIDGRMFENDVPNDIAAVICGQKCVANAQNVTFDMDPTAPDAKAAKTRVTDTFIPKTTAVESHAHVSARLAKISRIKTPRMTFRRSKTK